MMTKTTTKLPTKLLLAPALLALAAPALAQTNMDGMAPDSGQASTLPAAATPGTPTLEGALIMNTGGQPLPETVRVQLPSGETVSVQDTPDAPWRKDPRLQGYERFVFQPESGTFKALASGDTSNVAPFCQPGLSQKDWCPPQAQQPQP